MTTEDIRRVYLAMTALMPNTSYLVPHIAQLLAPAVTCEDVARAVTIEDGHFVVDDAPVPTTPTRFKAVKEALRAFNVTIARRPDMEYRVNFMNGTEASAAYTNDLADAFGTGITMALWKMKAEAVRHVR